MSLKDRLGELNIVLPAPTGTFGAYVPVKRAGNLVYVAGQLPARDGKLVASGQVPSRCSIEQAQLGARQCVINALAAVAHSLGSPDPIRGVLRVGAFVSSDATFTDQPKVANAASELLVAIFGDAGRHVRAAVGANTLPLDAAVEIEFIFETA